MTETLATEPQHPEPEHGTQLEAWGDNARMRHIPSLEWIIAKVDGDVRRITDVLWSPYAALSFDDPRHAPLEAELRALCRALDRLADCARHSRANHAPGELGARLHWAVDHAVAMLRSVDGNLFGRRYPVQTHERSKAEPVYAALLVVIQHLWRIHPLALAVDPDLDERLLSGLVRLENPVDERMLRPIA
jgi:hypothetical protein